MFYYNWLNAGAAVLLLLTSQHSSADTACTNNIDLKNNSGIVQRVEPIVLDDGNVYAGALSANNGTGYYHPSYLDPNAVLSVATLYDDKRVLVRVTAAPVRVSDYTAPANYYACKALSAALKPLLDKVYSSYVRGSLRYDTQERFTIGDGSTDFLTEVMPGNGTRPPASGCSVTGGPGAVDVSAGPARVDIGVTCSTNGFVRLDLLDSKGAGASGGVLTDGTASVTVSLSSGQWSAPLAVTRIAPLKTFATITAAPGNAVGRHLITGVIRVSTY